MAESAESIIGLLPVFLGLLPHVQNMGRELEEVLTEGGLIKIPGGVVSWAELYELPFMRNVFVAAHTFGAGTELRELVQSATPNLAILRSVEDEVSGRGTKTPGSEVNPSLALGAVLSLVYNMRSFSTHGVPINVLLKIGNNGSDAALLKAVSIDPSVVTGKSLALRIARATAEKDKRFFKSLIQAIGDAGVGSPRAKAPRERHPRLKYCLSILEDAHILDSLSERTAYQFFAEQLGVYPQEGQSKDASRSLWRLISRWKKFVRHE